MTRIVDLRSDTVTRPGPAMRRAMAEAEVGENLYREDPGENLLERRAAEYLGKEDSVFVPTGTMGNLIALKVHGRPGDEVILEERSHIYNSEMAGISAVCGLLPHPVRGDARGLPSWEDVEAAIRPAHRARTRLLCLENTHNFAGGAIPDQTALSDLCRMARERGLSLHLDGARIANAAAASGVPAAKLAAPFDSVMMSFSKGLGAPAGAALAGSAVFVAEGRRARKLFGGAIHQPGVLAAACLYSLDHVMPLLDDDHRKAKRLAAKLSGLPGLIVDPAEPMTNIVILRLESPLEAASFAARLAKEGVLVNPMDDGRVRLVTHCDVSDADIETALDVFSAVERARR